MLTSPPGAPRLRGLSGIDHDIALKRILLVKLSLIMGGDWMLVVGTLFPRGLS